LKIPSEITFEITETNWVCMIVFLCAHVRISISTYKALLYTYRIGLHQVTPIGVVFLFMLVNWWVEKHQRFLFNVYRRFLFLSRFVRFLTFFIFYGTFFTSMPKRLFELTRSAATTPRTTSHLGLSNLDISSRPRGPSPFWPLTMCGST